MGVKTVDKKYPYKVSYTRTLDWWKNEGRWYQISHWNTDSFGDDSWDYINECFVFETEQQLNWFKLRWLA